MALGYYASGFHYPQLLCVLGYAVFQSLVLDNSTRVAKGESPVLFPFMRLIYNVLRSLGHGHCHGK